MRIYVPGANRTGRAAWPHSTDEDAAYAAFPEGSSPGSRAGVLANLSATEPSTVIAHSLGAVWTLLAIQMGLLAPKSLILAEPALFDIARGHPSVEEHIDLMTRARAEAARGNLLGYWELVKPRMFGEPALPLDWPQDEPHAQRFSTLPIPWGHDLTARAIENIPTLVLTGGWNDQYEAMASVLVQHGADHRILPGSGHRPQDQPEFEALVSDFEQGPPDWSTRQFPPR